MRIDLYGSEPHFIDHLAPVWAAMPDQLKGRFVVHMKVAGYARRFIPDVQTRGLDHKTNPTLVASYGDLKRARKYGPCVYMEHGAGQSYVGTLSGSYIGGERDGVTLILVPGRHAYDRAVTAYPDIPVEIVGTPKLDQYFALPARPKPTSLLGASVGVSFHWDAAAVAPEARSASRVFLGAIPKLASHVGRLVGHGHPRAIHQYAKTYVQNQVDVVHRFTDVVRDSDIYVCDNSSTLFEFATVAGPVVLLNAPWYRRDVEHGLRFWEFADIGPQVDHPDQLLPALEQLIENDRFEKRRAEITEQLYSFQGAAADRVVQVLSERFG